MNVTLKRGTLLRHQGRFYFVDDVTEHHSAKQRPAVHVALHDAVDGRHIERSLDDLQPVEEVPGAYRTLQYLYAKGGRHVFMDTETFDERDLSPVVLHGCEPFLKEGDEFRVLCAGDQPLRLEMPESVVLRVTDTAAPGHAVGTAGNVMKEAALENGLQVRVPLFIKAGERVRVDTRTRQYLGRATGSST